LLKHQNNVLPQGYDASSGIPYNMMWLNTQTKSLDPATTDMTLKSWYVPPNFRLVFFRLNPVDTAPVAAGPYLVSNPGTLVTDAFSQQLTLTDGKTLFVSKNSGGKYVVNAPYMAVIQLQSFEDLLLDICVNNQQVYLSNFSNSLNTVWVPQTKGCDDLVTAVCKAKNSSADLSAVITSRFGALCNCFDQQDALNRVYTEKANVSSCCFGHLVTQPPGDFENACAFSSDAYKTLALTKSCCTIPVCQSIQENFVVVPGQKPPSCSVGKVVLPGSNSTDNTGFQLNGLSKAPTTNVIFVTPVWIYVMLGLSVAFLLLLLILFVYWPSRSSTIRADHVAVGNMTPPTFAV
jgi:hypothetical protein